jgi:transposase InsO family protein
MSKLEKLYYDPSHYAGFSAVENLTRAAKPNFTRNKIVHWLESQDAYSLHRPLRRKFPRLHYNVTNIDDVWEGDLIELRNLKSYNDGYSYILVIIDVLSKFVWVEPLQDKTSAYVTKAFQRILSRSKGRVPVYLQTDKGKEFVGRALQKFLEENDIRFRVTRNPDIKAAVVERFNRTLKERMWRYFTHKNTRRYIDVLQDIVHAYNHTRHSSTRMQPTVVTRENARIARENITRRWKDNNKIKNRMQKAKYHVGDLVRVSRAKGTFEKGYEANWSEEIFRIHRVLEWRNPRVYELSDLEGEVIDGIFYEQELGRVDKNLEEEEFIVDRVIKSRGRGANKQLLVSWRGYPSKFDSWIPASNLTQLQDVATGAISHDSTEQ